MQRRPTVGPGSQKAPLRERLPGTISKLGKGTPIEKVANMGIGGGVWCERAAVEGRGL